MRLLSRGQAVGTDQATGTTAAAVSHAAQLLLLPRQPPPLSASRRLLSDNRQLPADSQTLQSNSRQLPSDSQQTAAEAHVSDDAAHSVPVRVLNAGLRSECVETLIRMLARPGDAKVRLHAARALQIVMDHALRPPPLLSKQAKLHESRTAANFEAAPIESSAEGEGQSVHPLGLEQLPIAIQVCENSERPVSLSFSASLPIVQPPSGVSRPDQRPGTVSQAQMVSARGQIDLQRGSEVFIPKQLIAVVAAAAADAVSDESPEVAAASSQLLQQLAAPAAVLASDSDAEAALEQPKWLIQVPFSFCCCHCPWLSQ